MAPRTHRVLLFVAVLIWNSALSPLQAVKLTPIAHISALGGQYFTGSTQSSGLNADASLVPVLEFTPRLFLIPIYLGSYKETQSVYNFLGQNTLITRQLDQAFILRSAWIVNPAWRLKPRIGYKKEWTKQSTDESLWDGLFKYNRFHMGVSAERTLSNGSLELGYEYSTTRYPNYHALIADSRLTATGINFKVGQDVLNFDAHETTVMHNWETPAKRWQMNETFSWIREDFIDQLIITSTADGGAEDTVQKNRADDIFNLSAQQTVKTGSHWTFGFGETLQYYLSNQNAFDATQQFSVPFTYRYYNFTDLQLNPALTYSGNDGRWDTTLALNGGYRRYSHRRMQSGDGSYQDRLIYSFNRGATLTARYRLRKGLYAVLTGNVLTYSSNTRYEANYPYNYTVSTYLGGLSWEY